ncbi:hypothetical protein [Natrinema halophilum]|uniref:Uncharacterized protein n=1 Tax=Natrinema halophilum TaxID=1699371 RepID=A0A7D5H9F8_9EURY|nr:hypothetical protein [Natrinema halophilum]QLG50235.1 hypothetical protein HYG82_15960 [Natrinema halophilum]
MATCRELGCNRKATRTVVVNAPGRGYAEDPACTEHTEKARGRVYVSEVLTTRGDEP